MESNITCLLQECTLFEVKKLVCYKNVHYLGSIRFCLFQECTFLWSISTCLLQEGTLFGVKKDLSVTRMHLIWSQ